jgi:hypothetical protein
LRRPAAASDPADVVEIDAEVRAALVEVAGGRA